MKMQSLKITAADRKKREKEMKASPQMIGSSDEYPWGFRITLDKDLLKKFPAMADADAGATFNFQGKVRVKEVTATDRDGEDKNQRVELQITDIGFESNEDQLDEDFDSED